MDNTKTNDTDALSDFEYSATRLFSCWLYLRLGRWQGVADFFDVHRATAWKVGNDPDYEPADNDIRESYGLRAYAPAPVCPRCGAVHTTKRCTANDKPKRRPPWYRCEENYPSPARWEAVTKGWVE